EREAAAADALGEPDLEAAKLADALVDARAPRRREARPVAARRGAVGRELVQLGADLVEREADALGEDDERDPPQDGAPVAAVAGARALGLDQPALLVEAQRRRRDAAAPGDLADGEQLRHLTSSLLELVASRAMERAFERITREVTSWPGVESGP